MLRIGARKLGASVELHVLDAPLDVLFERICQRNLEHPAITFDDLQRWDRIFERPSAEEMALFDAPLSFSNFRILQPWTAKRHPDDMGAHCRGLRNH
jgi:hypothetical protein